MIGTVIDGCYKVVACLGQGQFGTVYRCHDLELERDVALKILSLEKAGQRELQRCVSEARKLASLNHPNVVQAYRLGNWNGSPYIAMEFIEGRTLKAATAAERLTLPEALKAMRQVAAGLQAIHSMGIVHRDLSTNNIMITEAGNAKILDLGLAKDLGRLTSVDTQGMLVGTMAYVAPEVVQGESADARSEIFSFGVILYEVLAGRNPFQAEHVMSLLYSITNREPGAARRAPAFLPTGSQRARLRAAWPSAPANARRTWPRSSARWARSLRRPDLATTVRRRHEVGPWRVRGRRPAIRTSTA